MRDLYQRLNLPPEADADAIRRAAESAEPSLRTDATAVLLDPRRRVVYDRNHRLLRTIGELRMHLGLNYTRFWARQEFRDFRLELAPAPVPRGRRVDALLIAHAIRNVGRRGSRHIPRHRAVWIIAMILFAISLALLFWQLRR